jgi:hypothetical protein
MLRSGSLTVALEEEEGVAEEVASVVEAAVEVPVDTREAMSTTTVAVGGRTATSVPRMARGAY